MPLKTSRVIMLLVFSSIFSIVATTATTYPDAQETFSNASVSALTWSEDATRLIVARYDASIAIFDPVSGQEVGSYNEHDAVVREIALHPDGQQIATGDDAGVISIWNIETNETVSVIQAAPLDFPRPITTLGWFNEASLIITSVADTNALVVYDVSSGERANVIRIGSEDFTTITSLAVHPDDTTLVAASSVEGVYLWRLESDQALNFSDDLDLQATREIDWRDDGAFLAVGNLYGDVTIFDVGTESLDYQFAATEEPIFSIQWSPSGENLLITDEAAVYEWNVSTRASAQTFSPPFDYPKASYSPFGGRIAIGGRSSSELGNAEAPSTELQRFNNGFAVIIPVVSNRAALENSETLCAAAASDATVFDTLATDDLLDYINQVEALADDGQIAPGCAADLIAVAQAILAEE